MVQPGLQTKRIGMIGTVPDPSLPSAVGAELAPLLEPGNELVGYSTRIRAFPSTPLERSLQDIGHAEAAFTAVEDGCSAVVIDSVGDYGLATMRASLPVPAVGAGEAGMAEAASGGRRFAIVSVWPDSMNFIIHGRLREYGYAETCLGIYNVGEPQHLASPEGISAELSRIRRGDRTIKSALQQAMAAAVRDGADAIMLGCTCMSPMAADLQASSPVPVVNPLAAGVVAALAAGPVTAPALATGRRELLRTMVASVASQPVEPCPVCIVSA
jgi:allantoin racemase